MPSHRWLTPLVGLSLALATPAAAAPPRPPTTAPPTTITLITGDRIQVQTAPGQREHVTFQPGPGSGSTAAITSYKNGHTYVVPTAAAAGLASGRLDRALFDVTTLLAEGADDAHSKTLPVIIRYAGAPLRPTAPGTTGSRSLTSIGARATRVQKSSAATFWSSLKSARTAGPVERISLDHRVTASLDQSVPQIGAPAAWQRGLTGKGVKIAVLDTGIDPNHPDLKGRIAAAEDFSGTGDVVDHFGHGTHVASIAAGNGAASGGKYKGVAPDATLLNGKVLDDDGNGYDSGIIAGMEWAAAQGASVVNLSLGSREPSDGTDDLSQAVDRLSQDTLFVVAAGNCPFPDPATIGSPGAADEALTVGNLQRDGSVNDSSCRGPRLGDGALKPEISAPGTDIVAARAAGTSLGTPVDDNYTTLTGTSMATPHVAGTAALLAQAHPDWKSAALKTQLISTANPQPGSEVTAQGAGRVDADQATADGVTADTAKLELGRLNWPYPADDAVTRDLTYRNSSATPVTLKLTADVAGPKLSTDQLVVPAHGEAKVTVTVDRGAAGPGSFSGRIIATGTQPLVTLVGWTAERELYNLTIKGIQHNGAPANGELALNRLDNIEQPDLGPFGLRIVDGTATVRVPPGTYDASSVFFQDATDTAPQRFDLVASDETTVGKDTTITLDARKTTRVGVSAQGQAELGHRDATLTYVRSVPSIVVQESGVISGATNDVFAASRTAKPTIGSAEFAFGTRLEVSPYRASVVGGPAFPVLDYFTGPRFTGKLELPVVDGGHGSPAEVAGSRGKLVLIRNGEGDDVNGVVTKNAQDAGAAAVILFNPDVAGEGGAGEFWRLGDNGDPTIPAARTSRASAAMLLDRLKTGPVSIRLTGVATSPYVYDLGMPWQGQLPANPVVSVRPDQLARVDETFGSQVAGVPVSEGRYGYTPLGARLGGSSVSSPGPVRQTAYVQANQVKWAGTVTYDAGLSNAALDSVPRTYRAGEHVQHRWLTAVGNSSIPDGDVGRASYVGRDRGGLAIGLSTFGHGADQYLPAYAGVGGSELTVTRNGVEVLSTTDAAGFVETTADAADYTIALKTGFDGDVFRYSTHQETTWTFRSKGGEDEKRMPLVLADLDVPQSDALNQVKVGKPIDLTLGLRHQFGSGSTAKFAKPTLEISYDGSTWTALSLTGSGSKYSATVTHPVTSAGKSPSLRLTARDADGNSITQQITAAYGLAR
ncbi:S8 family serine peptidase [Kribbella sp. NPDC051587]|uniref:S8 family serine peptidase n=1 Tax=Kribbella sp. NPDC051587 TaxID=3364119 RepID=UPI0037A36E18